MTTLTILRHGETDWNLQGRMQGQADIPLNARGLAQAQEAAQRLAGRRFDAIWSSPLSRASDTARTVAAEHGLDVHPDPRLGELNIGSWSGLTMEECDRALPELRSLLRDGIDFRRSATGETAAEVECRALAAVRDIVAAHPDGSVLVVTHGYLTQVLVSALLGLPGYGNQLAVLTNARCAVVEGGDARWRLRAYGI